VHAVAITFSFSSPTLAPCLGKTKPIETGVFLGTNVDAVGERLTPGQQPWHPSYLTIIGTIIRK
jgi:hypothetical protein